MDGFDLSKYELNDTATLTVLNEKKDAELIGADGENPVTIELYSPGSPKGVKALQRAGRGAQKRLHDTIRGKLDPKAAEQADAELVDKLVGFTKQINNFPVDPQELYANPRLGYITRQVDAFVSEEANFSKASSTN